MLQSLPGHSQRQVLARPLRQRVGPIVLTVAVGVSYFLAARLSLHLLTMSGVAVFWPAAGVSSGILIALGRDARWPVAAGVIAANTVANLMGDRNLWGSAVFSLSDVGEALLVAWMIERYIGSDFDLGKLRHVLGLLAATVVGTAVSGIGATLGFKLVYGQNQPVWITWQQWVASDSLGIIAVAPLIIGLVATLRAPPSRRELVEGAAALIAVVATAGTIIFMLPADWWEMCVAVVLLFPAILWVAARCRPAVASAAVFIVSLIVITTVTLKLGNYGLKAPSMGDSIVSAQITVAGTALCALVLSALFAERRQQKAVLVESETRLQQALAIGSVLSFEWDVTTDLILRSDNAAQVLGFEPKQAFNGKMFLSQVHPDDLPRLKALWRTINRDNPRYSTAYRFLRRDGREIWLQETSQAEFDDAGRLLRVTGLTRDITERKRAEEHDALLRIAQASTGVGIWGWDVRTKELRVSSELEELYGLKPGSMRAYADFRERVHPDDIEFVEAQRDASSEERQRFQYEFRIIHPNGETRWLAATGSAVYDQFTGEPIRFLGNNFDITERKKSENALRESEERFRSVVSQTGVGISITDLNGTVKFANQKFCKMLGFDDDAELVGKPIWEVTYGDPSPENKHLFDRLCDTGESYEIEKRLIRKDGSPLWAHISVWAVCDATGKPQSTTCVTRDITERKRAQERQALLVAELDHRVKNILAQVAVVASSTRQGSRSIDEFLRSLDGRIHSMAAAHSLLGDSSWENVCLATLVRSQLAPYATDTNVTVSGTDVMLNSAETQAVARVLHELATNAAKYGALSVPRGQVSVKWDFKLNGTAANLTLVWRELGGPPVAFDHPSSYGTNLIRNLIPHELGGTVDLAFAVEGVNCRIKIPMRRA